MKEKSFFEYETGWCVITGAPSSGKTSVLEELARRGYQYEPEVARALIQQALAKGETIDHIRQNKAQLQKEILKIKLEREGALPKEELVFLDRAIPDSISYYRFAGLDPAEAVQASMKYHYRKVFVFDRLPLQQDGVRTENEGVADLLDRVLEEDYRMLGYDTVRVPVMSISARADFILEALHIKAVSA